MLYKRVWEMCVYLPQCISILSTLRALVVNAHARIQSTNTYVHESIRVYPSCILYWCYNTRSACTMSTWYSCLFFVWLSHTNVVAPVYLLCLLFVAWVYFPFHRAWFKRIKEIRNICTHNYKENAVYTSSDDDDNIIKKEWTNKFVLRSCAKKKLKKPFCYTFGVRS